MDVFTAGIGNQVIGPANGEPLDFGSVRGRLKVDARLSAGRVAAAHFPAIPPRTLGAPLHRHHREDEYTCVLAGTLSVQLGDRMLDVTAGNWVIKPRGQWHTFWNAQEAPCAAIEIVSPAGFEQYFKDAAALGGNLDQLASLNATYGIDMDFQSVSALCERFRLQFPLSPM